MVGWLTNCVRRRVLSSPNQASLGGATNRTKGLGLMSDHSTGVYFERNNDVKHILDLTESSNSIDKQIRAH